ncbi:hypothetical protein DO66_5415 [Burkholderia pseudomallei]|nr:hypothetical protein DO66_5415 [Burkholderia pseudomallei]
MFDSARKPRQAGQAHRKRGLGRRENVFFQYGKNDFICIFKNSKKSREALSRMGYNLKHFVTARVG